MINNITTNTMELILLNDKITTFIHADNNSVTPPSNTSTPAIIYVPNIKELTSHNGKKPKCFKLSSIRKLFFQEKTEEKIAAQFNQTANFDFNKRKSNDDLIEPTPSPKVLNPSESIYLTCESKYLQECSKNMPYEILNTTCTGILMFESKSSTCKCSIPSPMGRKSKTPVRTGWSKYTR